MRRLFTLLATVVFGLLFSGVAHAGSPHVPDAKVTASVSGSTLTVAFKESGLGDETQITVQVTATAHCVNPGGNDPQANNKAGFTETAVAPVQNGQASGTLVVTAVFKPSCSPPMTVVWDSATYQDLTNGIVVDLTDQV